MRVYESKNTYDAVGTKVSRGCSCIGVCGAPRPFGCTNDHMWDTVITTTRQHEEEEEEEEEEDDVIS